MTPTVGHLLNQTLQLWRATVGADDGGGQTTTWSQVATLPGRVSQPSAVERQRGAVDGADVTHQVYTAPRSGVLRGDQLRTGRGLVLQVLAVFEPSVPVYLRADCELRQSDGSGV